MLLFNRLHIIALNVFPRQLVYACLPNKFIRIRIRIVYYSAICFSWMPQRVIFPQLPNMPMRQTSDSPAVPFRHLGSL